MGGKFYLIDNENIRKFGEKRTIKASTVNSIGQNYGTSSVIPDPKCGPMTDKSGFELIVELIKRRINNQEQAIKANTLQQKEKEKKIKEVEADIVSLEKKIKNSERDIHNLSPPEPQDPQYTSLQKNYKAELRAKDRA